MGQTSSTSATPSTPAPAAVAAVEAHARQSPPGPAPDAALAGFWAGVLRQQCYLSCNPSPLKQRLIRGARDPHEHWAKLESFKETCAVGCDLAAASPAALPAAQRAAMDAAHAKAQAAGGTVLEGDAYELGETSLKRDIQLLRTACYAKCTVKFEGDDKRIRMCGDGCDHLFNNVLD